MVLSAEDCAKVVALVKDGRSQPYVARVLNVSHSTIQRVARYPSAGLADVACSGTCNVDADGSFLLGVSSTLSKIRRPLPATSDFTAEQRAGPACNAWAPTSPTATGISTREL
ncbi:hypothetical protein ILUMI_09925 [Ignelater luminosus]|uniref:Uncharacterized protein n=1 Tax=Ignelater luminosus TaxID=2038154 RepID=A0A8K0GFH2_IGNLU|nr:hypothetical protein ILUMI_09925 [Ignelater luminosus]